jgi:hypothetical protein
MSGIGGGSWSARVGTDPFDSAGATQSLTTIATYLARSELLAGLAPTDPFLFDDFTLESIATAAANWQTVVSAGSINTSASALRGGAATLATTAAANAFAGLLSIGALTGPRKTSKWYCAFRMAVTTAIDAQAQAACGLHDVAGAGQTTLVGVFGAGSIVNFCAQYDGNRAGSFLNLGVPIDTNFHVFEMYCKGDGVLRVIVDGGTEITVTPANVIAGASDLHPWVANGTTAAIRSANFDWVLGRGDRP